MVRYTFSRTGSLFLPNAWPQCILYTCFCFLCAGIVLQQTHLLAGHVDRVRYTFSPSRFLFLCIVLFLRIARPECIAYMCFCSLCCRIGLLKTHPLAGHVGRVRYTFSFAGSYLSMACTAHKLAPHDEIVSLCIPGVVLQPSTRYTFSLLWYGDLQYGECTAHKAAVEEEIVSVSSHGAV